MMKSVVSGVARRLPRKGESGQAIIILALGFIALIAFVGIVTDVSLMFVRYSTLSRAVDAAAIAAAGQMRSDRNFGEVGLAARQFIEFHGLNPEEVLVQTCQTAKIPDPNWTPGPGDTEADHPLVDDPTLCPADQRKLVRVTARVKSPTIFMRLLGFSDITLTAVAVSETAVLDVVVIMDVSESMLFDTTYEQWADIGMGKVYVPPRLGGYVAPTVTDAQEGDQTNPLRDVPDPADTVVWKYSDGSPAEVGTVYRKEFEDQLKGTDEGTGGWLPAHWSDEASPLQLMWDDFVLPEVSLQQDINDRLYYTSGGSESEGNLTDPDYQVDVYDYPDTTGNTDPRFDCRVRFWPYSSAITVDQAIKDTYTAVGATWTGSTWDGFVPTFNFYGCCNDPTTGGVVNEDGTLQAGTMTGTQPDWKFNDLICQPFKQARDATRKFIDRIDFARGDRLAFVTFDRGSFLMDPDGVKGIPIHDPKTDAGYCAGDALVDATDPDDIANGVQFRTNLTHMIESKCRAIATLDQNIGVRAEPNFYVWKEDGGWGAYADGRDEEGNSLWVNYGYHAADAEDITNKGHKVYNNFPVKDNCPLQNGAMAGFKSRYSLWTRGDYAQYTLAGDAIKGPGLYRTMIPTPWGGDWAGNGLTVNNSYELFASCRGTNMGAALREGSNALLDPSTTRRTGTVWVMVLLSDGAAGASDPVRQNGEQLSVGKVKVNSDIGPYADHGPDPVADGWEDWGGFTRNIRYGTVNSGQRTQYGSFGLCPIGTPVSPTRLTRNFTQELDGITSSNPIFGVSFPFCSDVKPETRHFCLAPGATPADITKNEDMVGGQCSDSAAPGDTASGDFQAGFRPAAKDAGYECNPVDLGTNPNYPDETILEYNLRKGHIYDVDIGDWTDNKAQNPGGDGVGCDPLYDVDDYARDWADYMGLSRGSGDQQLPSIFTIGFGLNFPVGAVGEPGTPGYQPGTTLMNIPDYLGEELLRYIADVGDNFEIDTDYEQDWRDNGILDNSLANSYGQRGPCEAQIIPDDQLTNQPYIAPLPPRTNCGNYYNAPNQAELELVFDDIASRMFTRLTG